MELTWTQDPPKVAGLYWKRNTGNPDCKPEPVKIEEYHLDPETAPMKTFQTPQERRASTLESLRRLKTDEKAMAFMEGLPEEHWQVWWCGPITCPPF